MRVCRLCSRMSRHQARLAAVLFVLGAGAFVLGTGTGHAGIEPRGRHDGLLDQVSIRSDSFDTGDPAVVDKAGKPDPRLGRALKPVLATVALLGLTWALAPRWWTSLPYGPGPGHVISRRAAPRGPPARLT
jgi:hypothetical protein